ncbi:hypothetical protein ACFWW8_31160, partial [Streptomyces sp. NPDC058701]
MTEIITGLYMSPLEFLALLGAVALVVARWLPPAARPRVTIAAGAVLALSSIVLGVVGVRWQMLPVLAGGAVALPFALSPLLRRRGGPPGRRGRGGGGAAGGGGGGGRVAPGAGAARAFKVNGLTQPA